MLSQATGKQKTRRYTVCGGPRPCYHSLSDSAFTAALTRPGWLAPAWAVFVVKSPSAYYVSGTSTSKSGRPLHDELQVAPLAVHRQAAQPRPERHAQVEPVADCLAP